MGPIRPIFLEQNFINIEMAYEANENPTDMKICSIFVHENEIILHMGISLLTFLQQ